jgi:hypothetical protein
MAKRKPAKRKKTAPRARKRAQKAVSGKRPTRRAVKAVTRKSRKTSARKVVKKRAFPKPERLNRARRTLDETVQTPPSSLDMDRRGTAVRTGRAEAAQSRHEHKGMSTAIKGGDVDVDLEDAYFTGDEAPGGDNPTPDQDIVDDIGKALGLEYQDNEELKAADKVTERDRKRWELDPASSEDYKERK